MTWLQNEPPLMKAGAAQVRRLQQRAWRRPWITAGVALALAGGLYFAQARKPKLYAAEVGLLVSEGVFSSDGRPRPRGELLSLINRAAFSKTRLEELVARHNLVKQLRVPNESIALARMRKLIEVEVWDDHFVSGRRQIDPPRTVRVTIQFSAPDPSLALEVARNLGEFVADTEKSHEVDIAEERVQIRRAALAAATGRASGLREEWRRAVVAATKLPGGGAYLGLQQMAAAVQVADQSARDAAEALLNAELQVRAIRNLGPMVQVIDSGKPYWQGSSRAMRIARQAGIALATAVVLAIVLVGAWDPAIRDNQDLARVHLRYLGDVPRARNDSGAGV